MLKMEKPYYFLTSNINDSKRLLGLMSLIEYEFEQGLYPDWISRTHLHKTDDMVEVQMIIEELVNDKQHPYYIISLDIPELRDTKYYERRIVCKEKSQFDWYIEEKNG